jgi:uncharacterized repeat protein (TIGR01451 family)
MFGIEALRVVRRDRARAGVGESGRRSRRPWAHVLVACSLFVGATGAGFIVAEPAGAAIPVTPFVDCVVHESGTIWTVYFGYSNTGNQPYDIPVGANNMVDPGTPFQGQPTTFDPGTYVRVFRSQFDFNLFNGVIWTLNGQQVFGSPTSTPCRNGVTAPASALTLSSATLNGSVDPAGDPTTWHFEYGTTIGYGQTTPNQTATGTQVQLVQAPVGGLQNSTPYHFALVASNGTTTSTGADQSFTTAGPAAIPIDLSITKVAAAATTAVGQNLTYTLTATNNSAATATGVTISDPLPGGATFVSATLSQGSCPLANLTVTCAVGSLASGQSATATIVVTPTQAGVLTNTGVVAGDQADPNHANDFQATRTTVTATGASTLVPRFTG